MAGTKRHRDIDDIGERPGKLSTMYGSYEEYNIPLVDPQPSINAVPTASSKLRAPSTRNTRPPFNSTAANGYSSNVTTRKKRSASAPPKDLRPPATGIIKGQRTAEPEAVTTRTTRSRHKGGEDDPKWQRFEAQRNAGTSTHVSKTRRMLYYILIDTHTEEPHSRYRDARRTRSSHCGPICSRKFGD